MNELIRALHLSWFLQHAGYGYYPAEQLELAECAVEATLAHAHQSGKWQIPSDVVVDFEVVLALHDSQLASAPLHAVLEAEQKLRAFLGGTPDSPIPLST